MGWLRSTKIENILRLSICETLSLKGDVKTQEEGYECRVKASLKCAHGEKHLF